MCYISVCRDMELRVIHDSTSYTRAELCIDDQWYAIDSAVELNDNRPQNVQVEIDKSTNSLRVRWQPPNMNRNVDHYDTLCSTVKTNSGQYQMVKIGDLSPNTNVVDINLSVPSAIYNCCVTAYVRRPSLQLQTTSTSCVSLSIPGSLTRNPCINSQYTIGLGSALGFMVLLLSMVCLVCLCITLSYRSQARLTR